MIKPYMRWRDRQTLFRNVELPEHIMMGKLFAIGSCFAENVVGVLRKRQVDARLAEAGLFYTPGTVANYLELLSSDAPELTIFGAGDKCYAPQMETKWEGSEVALRETFEAQTRADRTWLSEADNVVITLGLNEQVIAHRNGEEYLCRQMPPMSVQKQLGDQLGFQIWTVAEIKRSLGDILNAVRRVNPTANLLFTVSPVPLHATFQSHDIRISNARSKYSLYAALQEFLEENSNLYYFPSFEHAQILQMDGVFWEDDERHVTSKGIGELMAYLATYAGETPLVKNKPPLMSIYDLKRSFKKVVKRGMKALGLTS